jgi:hypothetical protein
MRDRMQGRISVLAAGLALAFGGGVAGAALVGGGSSADSSAPLPLAPPADLAAERSAADAQKVAQAKLQHALRTAQRARRIARRARHKANESLATTTALLDDVDKALADSADALLAAQEAEADANSALARVDATQMVSATQNGLVQTANVGDYESLGGPQVTVDVPSSGILEVWATVTFGDDGNGAVAADGAVALYQDGQRVTQIDEENLCQSFSGSPLENMLLTSSGPAGAEIALSTPGAAELFIGGCGSIGSTPSPILIQASEGTHTYELRYGDCGCEPEPAGFKERVLRVAPHL